MKLGLCVVYALLILLAGLALALKLPLSTPGGQLMGLMLGLGVFGLFEGAEAYGLKRRRVWGSTLTVGRTLVMLPYGLFLMVTETDPIRELALLALNAAIALYLVRDLPRLKRNW